MAAAYCTDCHADLHRKDDNRPQRQNVTAFAVDHPEFALWAGEPPRDPGTVRFNHKLHLGLGNLSRLSDARTRSISPENFSGEPGKGGMALEGTGAAAARDCPLWPRRAPGRDLGA